ncbi:hypothetical protein ABAC402_07245 [Asticcacaulis sp. AC402]|nr:hypothetical protein ABAC402_07245 [Asticcacaulis sp. AC402]
MRWPLIQPASSDSNSDTTPPISSGSPALLKGVREAIIAFSWHCRAPRRRHQARRSRAFMEWVAAIMGDYLSKP